MRNARLAQAVVCLFALALGACETDYGPIVDAGVSEPKRSPVVFQGGNKIKVTVYGEPNLTGVYDITPTGFISLPLAGSIRAEGLTPKELEGVITRKYSDKLKDPQVSVEIVELRPFYIMGEVLTPGQFPYKSGLNLLTAISTAGGPTYRASRTSVFVQHAGEEGWHEHPLLSSVQILPGDLIRVPERYF